MHETLSPRIIVNILWQDIGEEERVVHRLLTRFIVPGRCHVTSTPPTSPEVLISSRVARRDLRVGLKGGPPSIGNSTVHHIPSDYFCHPQGNLLTPIVRKSVGSMGV